MPLTVKMLPQRNLMMATKEPYTIFTTSLSLNFQNIKLKISIALSYDLHLYPWRMFGVLAYEVRWSRLMPGLMLRSDLS